MLNSIIAGASSAAFALDPASLQLTDANAQLADLAGIPLTDLPGRQCVDVCAGPLAACSGAAPCPAHDQFQRGAAWLDVSLRCRGGGTVIARLTAVVADDKLAFIALVEQSSPCTTPAGQIQLCALGRFDIRFHAGVSVDVRRPQSLTLLKLLLMEQGHRISDETLVAAIWPDNVPLRAHDALRVLVHDLRRALEPSLTNGRASRFIVRQSAGYLMPEDAPISADVHTFDRLAAAGSRAAALGQIQQATSNLDQALRLYRGPLFEADAPASWFLSRRDQLNRVWRSALTLRAVLFARVGDHGAAIRLVEQATDADPSNENAHQLHLLLLARHQGRTAALQRYVALTREFRRRFGVAPSRETAALAGQLAEEAPLDALEREYWPLLSVPSADRFLA